MRMVAVAMVSASGTLASAQSITTQIVDSGAGYGRTELILRASPTTRDVMLAWMHWSDVPNSVAQVHYNVSTDGYSFGTEGPLTIPNSSSANLRGGDPMVAFDYNGVGYLGYISPFTGRFYVSSKAAGDGYADEAAIVQFYPPFDAIDKGILVAGAPPGQASGTPVSGLLFAYYHWDWVSPIYRVQSMVNPPSEGTPPDNFYRVIGDYGTEGGPEQAIILRNAPSQNNQTHIGRWLVAYHAADGDPCSETPRITNVRPRVAYSANGQSWLASTDPLYATIPCTSCSQSFEPILWFGCDSSPYLTDYGPFVPSGVPSIAADPRDENNVYMVFPAATGNHNNIDLFIARSTDGGQNFSGPDAQSLGQYVLHLLDSDLGDPTGSIQFLPSITVDPWGSVHVLYYVAWKVATGNTVEWRYRVKLASLDDFAVHPHPTSTGGSGAARITMRNVYPADSQQYFTLDHALVPLVTTDDSPPLHYRKLGDYNLGVDSRWCEIYAGFIAREPGSSDGPRVFVSRIVLDPSRCVENPNCYANCDASTTAPILNVADFTCFLQRYAQGCDSPSPCYPNCDHSTQSPFLNIADFSCFLQQYASGCQ